MTALISWTPFILTVPKLEGTIWGGGVLRCPEPNGSPRPQIELGAEENCWSGRLPVPPPSLTWYKHPEEFGSTAENPQPEELGRDYERRTELTP